MESVRNQGYGGVAAVDVLGQGDELLIGVWLNATVHREESGPRYVLLSLEKDDGRRKQLQTVRSELTTRVRYHNGCLRSSYRIKLVAGWHPFD